MSFQPKNILVTGAAGFIGCNFVRMMLNKYSDIKIISYDKLTYAGSLDNLNDVMGNPHHVFIQGDIGDRQLVAKVLKGHAIDTIVHFAAETGTGQSMYQISNYSEVNIHGTSLLFQALSEFTNPQVQSPL